MHWLVRRLTVALAGGTVGSLIWFGLANLFPSSDDPNGPLYPLHELLWPMAGVLAAAGVGAFLEWNLGSDRAKSVARAWVLACGPGFLFYLAGWYSDHGLLEGGMLALALSFWCQPLSFLAFAVGCLLAGPLAAWLLESSSRKDGTAGDG